MNTLLQILAQAANSGSGTESQEIPPSLMGRVPINDIWETIVGLNWLQAVIIIAFGALYLIYGWRIFKALVVINFTIVGMFAGVYLGRRMGSPLWGGILTTMLLGGMSLPLMKYSVSVLGAGAGAILGAAIWRAMSLPDPLIWCGGLAGLVAGAFMAFSSLKNAIMLFTSIQGSAFVVMGVLALLNDYPSLSEHISTAVYSHMFLLPSLLLAPTVGSIYFQQKLLKQENKWAMPE